MRKLACIGKPLGTAVGASLLFAATLGAAPAETVSHGFVGLADDATEARFFQRAAGISAWFMDDAFRFQGRLASESVLPAEPLGVNLFLTFEGAATDVRVEGVDLLPGVVHFMRGDDPAAWSVDRPTFRSIRYRGLYEGIDVVVDTDVGPFEYDLLLEPGVDPTRVVVRAAGGDAMFVDDDGALIIETVIGRFRQPQPETFTVSATGERTPVVCRYRLLGDDRYGFEVDGWDGSERLVIDPTVTVRTLLGGSGSDVLNAAAAGPNLDLYVAGQTLSVDAPTTAGAFDQTFNGTGIGADDIYVARIKSNGTALVYATYLGGTDGETYVGEFACGIVVDALGQAIVAGTSSASDYPTTAGALNESRSGSRDGVVTKLTATGGGLVFSTYIGGGQADNATGVALDAAGDIFVTGDTVSANFPVTANAFDSSLDGPGKFDGFLAVLDPTGATISYATFFGGTGEDLGLAVAVDGTGRAIVAGQSDSTDFPVSAGAFNATSNGGADIVAMKIDTTLGGADFSTYLGSGGAESGRDVAVDPAGNTYLVGGVDEGTFPITPGVVDSVFAGDSEAFVTVLNPTGTGLIYSTFLGGAGTSFFFREEALGVSVDEDGRALVAGRTNSSNFPTAGIGADSTLSGTTDGFFVQLAANGQTFAYSSLVGGVNHDEARATTYDATGRGYVVGQTGSPDFMTTSGSVQPTFGGGFSDGFMVKLDDGCKGSYLSYGNGCPGTGAITPNLIGGGCPESLMEITIAVTDVKPSSPGFFLVGLGSGSVNATTSCMIDVAPLALVLPVAVGAAGNLSVKFILPAAQPPVVVYLQAAFLDAGGTDGLGVTNALAIGIGTPAVLSP